MAKDQGSAKRIVNLVDPKMAGPVASVWLGALYSAPSPNAVRKRRDYTRRDSFKKGVQFIVRNTEDALDSVLPTATEEFFSSATGARRGKKFSDPGKLQWSLSAQPQ